jgi:hypothetical protein
VAAEAMADNAHGFRFGYTKEKIGETWNLLTSLFWMAILHKKGQELFLF